LRNGFLLGIKNLGGKLGGREVEVIVQDDELKPDVAVTRSRPSSSATRSTSWSADLLQYPAGDPEARDRRRRDPDLAQCRDIELRRQGMQARTCS
jgi:hypothetical protein